jgi:hypothetical protein
MRGQATALAFWSYQFHQKTSERSHNANILAAFIACKPSGVNYVRSERCFGMTNHEKYPGAAG